MSVPDDPEVRAARRRLVEASITDSTVRDRLSRQVSSVLRTYGIRDRATAEDVVQTAIAEALRCSHRHDPDRGPVGPWLSAIAANVLKAEARKHKKIPAQQGDDGPTLAELAVAARELNTWAETADKFSEISSHLTASEQQLFQWSRIDQVSTEEIGRRLGIKPTAARKRISRMLVRLSEIVVNTGGER